MEDKRPVAAKEQIKLPPSLPLPSFLHIPPTFQHPGASDVGRGVQNLTARLEFLAERSGKLKMIADPPHSGGVSIPASKWSL